MCLCWWRAADCPLTQLLLSGRSTLTLALHCVPDAAGQTAVEPLYSEVHTQEWGCGTYVGTHACLLTPYSPPVRDS